MDAVRVFLTKLRVVFQNRHHLSKRNACVIKCVCVELKYFFLCLAKVLFPCGDRTKPDRMLHAIAIID